MAQNRADYCMLCDSVPCSCNTKNNRKSGLPRKQAITQSVSAPTKSVVRNRLSAPSIDPAMQLAEIEERRALTVLCLSGLVHWQDVLRLAPSLNMTPTEIRALAWRLKHMNSTLPLRSK